MKTKIIIGIVAFICGVLVAFYSEAFFRKQIQELYQWTTSSGIRFVGKDFYIFGDEFHYLSFGLSFSFFGLSNWTNKINLIVKNIILVLFIFGITLFCFSAIDAHLQISVCTACNDGTIKLHWNQIEYGNILGTCSIISIIPTGISLIKKGFE